MIQSAGLLPRNNLPEDTPPNSSNTTFDYISMHFLYRYQGIKNDRFLFRYSGSMTPTVGMVIPEEIPFQMSAKGTPSKRWVAEGDMRQTYHRHLDGSKPCDTRKTYHRFPGGMIFSPSGMISQVHRVAAYPGSVTPMSNVSDPMPLRLIYGFSGTLGHPSDRGMKNGEGLLSTCEIPLVLERGKRGIDITMI